VTERIESIDARTFWFPVENSWISFEEQSQLISAG